MYVTGVRTTIVRELLLLEVGEVINRLPEEFEPKDESRYLFAQGYLIPARITGQSPIGVGKSLDVNLIQVMRSCERILQENDNARICIIGSESGIHGSYDQTYAAAKAGIHQYIRTRRVKKRQQLVGIAPSVIWDSGMTQRRDDLDDLHKRGAADHPKGRFLYAVEVARLVKFLLYEDEGYICNTVIDMDGGKHAQK